MAKFKELCSAYSSFRSEVADMRSSAYDMSNRIAYYYKQYLEIDDDSAFRLIPLDEKIKDGTTYSPAGATHLGDDGFWHLGILLTVYMGPNTYPKQPFKLSFKFIKNEDDSYLLNVDDLNVSYVISDIGNAEEFRPMFDKIQDGILNYFNENLKFLKGKHNKMSSIGFIQNSITTNINSENNE